MDHDGSHNPGNTAYNTRAPLDDSAPIEAKRQEHVRPDHLRQQQQQHQAFQAQQQNEAKYAQIAHDAQLPRA
jgi:hypothetical protein